MEQSFFRELLHYQRPKDNPFRLVFAGLVMFSILFLGYINHQLLISSFGSLGIFTFLYYQPLPLKQLMTRLSVVGSYLFLGNLLGMLSTHIAWLIPIVVALVGFGGRFFFEVYDISKPGGLLWCDGDSDGCQYEHSVSKNSVHEWLYVIRNWLFYFVCTSVAFYREGNQCPAS